jgi:hypothetical protein
MKIPSHWDVFVLTRPGLFIAVVLLNNARSFFLSSHRPTEFMLKHMASKFSAHLGARKPAPKDDSASPSDSTLSPHIPAYDYRGSVSTERTSASQDTQEFIENRRVRLPQRPKGTYRLSDFIIQRTLGTGSFGRVHLGVHHSCSSFCCVVQFLSSSQQT